MSSVVIFGLGPAGLFLARQLAKKDVQIFGIGRKDDIGLYSKYVNAYVAETKEEIISAIKNIKIEYDEKLIGYVCSDQYLTMLLNDCPEVFEIINFIGVKKEYYELINNKQKLTEFCIDLGFKLPKTYNFKELINKENVDFPIALKLNTKEINTKKNPIGKIKIIRNKKELNSLDDEISKFKINETEIIVQEYIEGDNNLQFSFGGYFFNGIEKAGIVVNQVGQYPQGISSLVLEIDDGEINRNIKELVLRFAESLKYTGFLEMEFKTRQNVIYLMDINPRTWGWVSILGKKYPEFHNILCEDNGITINKISELVMWKSPMRNYIGNLRNPLNVKKLKDRLNNYKKSNVAYDLYDPNDLKPVFATLKVIGVKLKKKLR